MSSFKLSFFEVLRLCFRLFSNQFLHTFFPRLSFQMQIFQTFGLNFQPPFGSLKSLPRTLKPSRFEFFKNGDSSKFGMKTVFFRYFQQCSLNFIRLLRVVITPSADEFQAINNDAFKKTQSKCVFLFTTFVKSL